MDDPRGTIRLGVLFENPAQEVKLHRVHHREINILAKPEICSLLEAAGGTDLYLPILVAVATGVRRVELLALRSSDIDFEAGNLTVRQSLERIG